MLTAQPLIQINTLEHTYAGQGTTPVAALSGVDLCFHSGEFVAIVGANGSGKTTLARHLNALLLPTQGHVLVDGMDTQDHALWPKIRAQVAMVFQFPEDQIVATTVEDDVAFGPENLGLPTGEIARRVRWALETVDMWGLRQRPPHLLSAGQQQRVAIAGALAMRPRGLVLDEATAMLDPTGRREVLALLRQLHREGLTVILITHWMNEAALAERVVALSAGQVAFDGPPRTMFADGERLVTLGLEPPPLAALAARLSRRRPDFRDLLTLDELTDALASRLPQDGPPIEIQTTPGPDPNAAPLVQVEALHHTYLKETPLAATALHDVSLQVYPGEVLALLGPTGSGKSTLLQHIAGLLPDPAGAVQIDAPASEAGRQTVGMLFQKPEQQLFETYVGDDVAFGPRQLGLDHAAVRERVRWAMETAGLPFETYKDRFTQSLSGGEKRKAALAGVLALRPTLLLLDEPTAGLDPRARQSLLDTLHRLNREQSLTLILATHAMEDVALLADRALILDAGRVVAQGSPRQLFAAPDRMAAYGLDVPAVTALMHRLRARGATVPADVLTVAEAMNVLEGALI